MLTLTDKGVHRAEVAAQDQGLDSGQKAWSGMVKSAELQHDTAVFRAARIEQGKLIEKGAVLKPGPHRRRTQARGSQGLRDGQGAGWQGGGGRGAVGEGGGVRSARQGR